MTEQIWLESSDPIAMMRFVSDRSSERKLRLLLVAMARHVWDLIPVGELRDAVIAAEQHADDLALITLVHEYRHRCYGWATTGASAEKTAFFDSPTINPIFRLARMASYSAKMLRTLSQNNSNWGAQATRFPTSTLSLMRDIFGNPFRSVTCDPAWRTSDAMILANGIYDERAFDRLPILADALQDAGCDSDDILNHLRDPHATHVRGCWALDLVLGKE